VGNTTNTSGTFTDLPGGTYNYSVVDGNSCSSSGSFVIPQGATIICSITAIPDSHIAGQEANTIFLGYGPQSIKLVGEASGGTGPYNYNWNGAGSTSSINVSPVTTTAFVLTVTDQNGCQSTCNVAINVIDVRCGNKLDKVQICHKNNGKSEGKTLCVSADAITAHLAHGDYLGSCKTSTKVSFENGTTLARNGEDVKALDIQSLHVKALPNPTSQYFTLQIETNNAKEKISLRILDLNGRQIELKNSLNSGQIVQVGNNYRPGIYIAELVQGKQRITVKLVKYPD
jgi:hypothetical protein